MDIISISNILILVLFFGFVYWVYRFNKKQDEREEEFNRAYHSRMMMLGKNSESYLNNEETNPQSFNDNNSNRDGTKFAQSLRRSVVINESKDPVAQDAEPAKLEVKTDVGMIYYPNQVGFDSLILEDQTVKELKRGMAKVNLDEFIRKDMGWEAIDSTRRTILNFTGPPGTGKTKAARAIANELKKPILHVDYSSVVSKWVGETGKNIKKIFDQARNNNAIIFLDEADTLLTQRSGHVESSNSEYLNQEKNILMQELDRFEGFVVLTTNLFSNYDEALLRRISQHVEFSLPSQDLREKLIQSNIPKETKLANDVDVVEVAKEMAGFSGGDIKNVIGESIVQCAIDFKAGLIPQAHLNRNTLLTQVKEIQKSKDRHKGIKKNKMGLGV